MSSTGFNNLVQPIKDYAALLALSNAGQAGNGLYVSSSMRGVVYSISDTGISISAPGRFNALADFTAAGGATAYGVGPVWIAGQQYWCDGTKLKPSELPWAGRRPKLIAFGNSITAMSCYSGYDAIFRSWSPMSFIHWLNVLSGQAFDYCRAYPVYGTSNLTGTTDVNHAGQTWSASTNYALGDVVKGSDNKLYWCNKPVSINENPTTAGNNVFDGTGTKASAWAQCGNSANTYWNINSSTEVLDQFGNYGAPANTSAHMAQRVRSGYLDRFIDTPDIVWLSSLFENDYADTPAQRIKNLNEVIDRMQQKWPNAIFIVSKPSPNEPNTATYPTYLGLQQSLITLLDAYSRENVFIDKNDSWYLNPGVFDGKFNARYGEYYSADGIASHGFNRTGATGSNVHHNTAGAVVRAKQFLRDFGWLSDKTLKIQNWYGVGIVNNSTKVISDDGAGNGTTFKPLFGWNPDYSRATNTASTASTQTDFVKYFDIDAATPAAMPVNFAYALNGKLQLGFDAASALPGNYATSGVASQARRNAYSYGIRFGDANSLDMSTFGANGAVFEHVAQLTIIDASNIANVWVEMCADFNQWWSNPGGKTTSSHEYMRQFQTGYANMLGCEIGLVAGDILTFKSSPFCFDNGVDVCRVTQSTVNLQMTPQSAAASGPTVEMTINGFVQRNAITTWGTL